MVIVTVLAMGMSTREGVGQSWDTFGGSPIKGSTSKLL